LAVKIRLRRMGARKRPFYRLVVADARSPRDGRFIEALGTYDPLQNPAQVRIDDERLKEWLGKGARPTEVARELLIAEGLLQRSGPSYPRAEKKPPASKKARTKAAAAQEAPATEAAPQASDSDIQAPAAPAESEAAAGEGASQEAEEEA